MNKRLLTYRDLEIRGYGSRTTVWRKTKDKSLNFPQPIDIGYGQRRFLENEISDYENARAALRGS